MTHASSVVLVLLVLASLSAAHPKAGLFGTGYPHDDKWFHGSNDPETAELCDSLRRHMDVLLRSKTFRCERLPGDAPDDVEKFCTSAGIPTIKKCMVDNVDNGDAAQCLIKAQEDIAKAHSQPLSWCQCQSQFESFLSVFSTSQLLCTENLLNNENRDSRLYGSFDAKITNTLTNYLGGPDKVFKLKLSGTNTYSKTGASGKLKLSGSNTYSKTGASTKSSSNTKSSATSKSSSTSKSGGKIKSTATKSTSTKSTSTKSTSTKSSTATKSKRFNGGKYN